MNYTTLVTAIQDTVENEFETADINRIIQLGEQACYNVADLPVQRKNLTGATLTATNRFYTMPADFRSVFSLAVINSSAYSYLIPVQPDFILEAFPTPATTGVPQYYGFYSETQIILGPTPASNYSIELNYSYYPTSIVTASTTWLGTNFETALLNACLVQAGIFLKSDEDIMKTYQAEWAKSILLLKSLAAGKLQQDAYRSGEVRTGVL